VLTTDALDSSSITSECLWANNEYERAIALHAVRRLLMDRASSTVGPDMDMIHGKVMLYIINYDDMINYAMLFNIILQHVVQSYSNLSYVLPQYNIYHVISNGHDILYRYRSVVSHL